MDSIDEFFNFDAASMFVEDQNNGTGNLDFSCHDNNMITMENMPKNPLSNHNTGNLPEGFRPETYMGHQYPNPMKLQPMAVQAGNRSSDLSMMSNAGNTTNYGLINQDTMQGFRQQPNMDQNQFNFLNQDFSQNGNSLGLTLPPMNYPSPESLGNSLPASQEQATANINTSNEPITTSTPATTQPASTSGMTSAPCQVTNSSAVPAPAPAGPAKRGRKRKATADPEAQTQAKGPAPKKLKLNACNQCRKSKVKCDGDIGKACSNCTKKGIECVIDGQDHRTKLTNFEEIIEKLEKKHFLVMECVALVMRASGSEEHFNMFKSCWKEFSTASNVVDTLGSFYQDKLDGSDDQSVIEHAQEWQSVSFRGILQELQFIAKEKVKVKDLRPLKIKLKKAAHWVLAEAYRALDTLAQQDAKDVVGDPWMKDYFLFMNHPLEQLDLSDQADAYNKSCLRPRGKLIPTFLKGKCGRWKRAEEYMSLVRQQLTPTGSPGSGR
ncbi:uncharacterized protein PG986_009040 [Apiospora aurea]|uniref:Zn(2)-C6 fungal-type domain-containing protein n=1 Tax=Apiospora aurea TaxID=335848 RepID=A0ABR1Q6J4_9PEZI